MSTTTSGYVTDGDVLGRHAYRDEAYSQPSRTKSARNVAATARSAPVASSSRHVSQIQPNAQSISTQQQQQHGKVLRTVHVVVQGNPIKEESLDSISLNDGGTRSGSESLGGDEEMDEDAEGEDEEIDQRTPHPRMPLQPIQIQPKRRVAAAAAAGAGKQKARGRASQSQSTKTITRRRWSEGRQVHDDDDEESESASATEDEADEYVPSSRPPLQHRSRARADEVDEEEEDELMLGGEVRPTSLLHPEPFHSRCMNQADRHDTYTPQRPVPTGAHTPVRRAKTQPARQTNGSAPSRKRNSPYPAAAAKKARNR